MKLLTFGRRRRPVQVLQTNPPPPPSTASPIQPPRQVRSVVVPRRYIPARITVLHTPVFDAPFQGARPLILVGRSPQPRRIPQPLSLHTRSLPNVVPPVINIWLPRPQVVRDLNRPIRWRPFLTRTNPGRLPSPQMPLPATVLTWRPGPPAKRPQVHKTRPISPSLTQLPKATVVRLPILPRWRGRPTLAHPVFADGTLPVRLPNPTVFKVPITAYRLRPVTQARTNASSQARPVPRAVLPAAQVVRPRGRPWQSYIVNLSAGQYRSIPPTRPLVIKLPRQPIRPQLLIRKHSGAGKITTLPLQPVLVHPPASRRLWPTAIWPATRYLLGSPAQHGPIPQPKIFPRPVRFWPQAYRASQTVMPGIAVPPPDLVAAAIAWLQAQPAVASAFGSTATALKFGSDLAIRNTPPPYVEFFEPTEDESYETKDGTGLPSSLTDGTLGMELVGTGKLAVRLLAELVASTLNDAPLVFQDGVLIYLRRSTRKYPTFRESGPGANVVIFKRHLEFDYKIERWAPNF
jgi:hypothetical protein